MSKGRSPFPIPRSSDCDPEGLLDTKRKILYSDVALTLLEVLKLEMSSFLFLKLHFHTFIY